MRRQYIRIGTEEFLIAYGYELHRTKHSAKQREGVKIKLIGYTNQPGKGQFIDGYLNLAWTNIPRYGIYEIQKLVKCIFKDKEEFFYDWLNIALTNPKQKLPAIVFENSTKESDLICEIVKNLFSKLAIEIPGSQILYDFNSCWVDKNMIVLDPVKSAKEFNIVSFLITVKHVYREAQNQKRHEIPFNGKFILNTNEKIEGLSPRFWKIKPRQTKNEIFFELTDQNICDFLKFLIHRGCISEEVSRLYFNVNELNGLK